MWIYPESKNASFLTFKWILCIFIFACCCLSFHWALHRRDYLHPLYFAGIYTPEPNLLQAKWITAFLASPHRIDTWGLPAINFVDLLCTPASPCLPNRGSGRELALQACWNQGIEGHIPQPPVNTSPEVAPAGWWHPFFASFLPETETWEEGGKHIRWMTAWMGCSDHASVVFMTSGNMGLAKSRWGPYTSVTPTGCLRNCWMRSLRKLSLGK